MAKGIKKKVHPSGTVYMAVVFRGYETKPDGSRKRLEHTKTFRLKHEAEKWYREQKTALERKEWVQLSTMTLGQYLDQWEQGGLKLGSQSQRTKDSYRELLRLYVRPHIGSVKLAQLTRLDVQRVAATVLAQPKTSGGKAMLNEDGTARETISPVTVRRALAALSIALNAATEHRLIAANPAQRIRLPRVETKPIKWLAREELNALLTGTVDDRHGVMWHLLAFTGLRPGEALGLAWAHVDLEAGVVRVQRSLGRMKKGADGKAWRLADTKTRKSRRTVPLPEAVTRALRSHRARQAEERLEAGEKYRDYGDGGFVFAKPDGSPYRAESQLQVLHRALARLGLPKVDLYSLRHAAASLRLHAGVPLKVVSELLGHSSIVLTADTYSHVTDQLQQDASDQFTAYMDAPTVRRA